MAKKSRLGQKLCPNCNKWIKGTRHKFCPNCNHEFQSKARMALKPVVAEVPAAVEKPTNGNTISLEQVRKVAQTVRAMGGFSKMTEVLAVIKEAGGVKKFRELAEAMQGSEADAVQV